jgi:hypothetical protein
LHAPSGVQDHEIQKLPEEQRPPEGFLTSEHERVAEAVLADVEVAAKAEV